MFPYFAIFIAAYLARDYIRPDNFLVFALLFFVVETLLFIQ